MAARRLRGSAELPEAKLAWEFLEKAKGWKKAEATKGDGYRLVGPEEDSAPMMEDEVGAFFVFFSQDFRFYRCESVPESAFLLFFLVRAAFVGG